MHLTLVSAALSACNAPQRVDAGASPYKLASVQAASEPRQSKSYVGFDRNVYPGDARLAELRGQFRFAGFWLTPPPGERANSWVGKRQTLRDLGFGFLVLANGRLDAQLKRSSMSPAEQGRKDGVQAIAAADREGFPASTILFLDQEEGGRLLPEQAAYFFAWTEAIAASHFRPGAYVSDRLRQTAQGQTEGPR